MTAPSRTDSDSELPYATGLPRRDRAITQDESAQRAVPRSPQAEICHPCRESVLTPNRNTARWSTDWKVLRRGPKPFTETRAPA
jgi:hypothetical protein